MIMKCQRLKLCSAYDSKKHIFISYRGQQPAQQQERQRGRISWLRMSKTNLNKEGSV